VIPLHTQRQHHPLPLRNGYIVDGRIAWWKVQTRRQAIVLSVVGELDASNARQFEASVGQLTSAGDPFVVDMGGVTFFDTQCIRLFLDVAAACRADSRPWALVVPSALQPIVRRCDRDGEMPMADCLPEALRNIAAIRSGALRLFPRRVPKSEPG
jgi:anti-anti-sigma factor